VGCDGRTALNPGQEITTSVTFSSNCFSFASGGHWAEENFTYFAAASGNAQAAVCFIGSQNLYATSSGYASACNEGSCGG